MLREKTTWPYTNKFIIIIIIKRNIFGCLAISSCTRQQRAQSIKTEMKQNVLSWSQMRSSFTNPLTVAMQSNHIYSN